MIVCRFLFSLYLSCFRKGATVILAFSWILGLTCGVFLSCAVGEVAVSLMGGCFYGSVSIVSLAQAFIIPFLFSAFAVYFSYSWLLPVICFGKALLFSFVFSGLSFAWGASAWFIRWGVLLCNVICMPLLYCWWLRNLSGTRKPCFWELLIFSVPVFAVATVVYLWIIPFAADVLIL